MAMKINLDRIGESPCEEHFEAPASWWLERSADAQERVDYEVVEPFRFQLRVHRMRNDTYLEGKARGAIELECSRCMTRYRHALREDFRLVLEPVGDNVPDDPEGAEELAQTGLCLRDEIELAWYRGSEIVLDELFGEVISAALPIQPLCSENCAGVCPGCGARREVAPSQPAGSCRCGYQEEPESDRPSPFAALAKLRENLDGGN